MDNEHIIALISLHGCELAKEALAQRPPKVSQGIVNFMNMSSQDKLQILGVTYKRSIIMATRKVIYQNNMVDNIQTKVKGLIKKIVYFKCGFAKLCDKGLPSF